MSRRAKPAPDMILEACRRLAVRPREALVIGDSPYDKQAAAAAGVVFAGPGIGGETTLSALSDILPIIAPPAGQSS